MSIHRETDNKMWYIYTMKYYYSAIKKNKNKIFCLYNNEQKNKIMPSIATWMDLESVIQSKSEKR